jgi:eukaryotic-like serine/threonine-protein kinase
MRVLVDVEVIAGRYRRTKYLGRGASGEVWLAHDELLNRQVAVKRLRVGAAGAAADDADVGRMMREAQAAARAHHPNIVSVFDLLTVEGQPYLVMEYVPGESLAELISRAGPLPVEQARSVIRQVADALRAAHELGIVHRDVKPANILIDGQGTAKLADFGVAKVQTDPLLTDTGLVVGTVAFMAPEVARGERATPASDIWSLGATLYAATEGRAPYQDDSSSNATALLVRLVTEPVPAPHPGAPLGPVIMRMLEFSPRNRPSAAEVVSSLGGRGPTALRPAGPSPQAQPERDVSEPTVVAMPPAVGIPAGGIPAGGTSAGGTSGDEPPAGSTDLDGRAAAPSPVRDSGARHRTTVSPRRRRVWVPLAAAVVVAGVGGGVALALSAGGTHSAHGSAARVKAGLLALDGASGSWSPDGRTLYLPAGNTISAVDLANTQPTRLITVPGDYAVQSIRVLPGGDAIAVAAGTADGQVSATKPGEVLFLDLAGRAIRQTLPLCGAPLPRGLLVTNNLTRFFVAMRTCHAIFDVTQRSQVWENDLREPSTSAVPTRLADGHSVEYIDFVINPTTRVPGQNLFTVDMLAPVPQAVRSVIGVHQLSTQGLVATPDGKVSYLFTSDNESYAGAPDAMLAVTMRGALAVAVASDQPTGFYSVGVGAQSAVTSPSGRYVLVLSTGLNSATKQQGSATVTILDREAPPKQQPPTVVLHGQGWGMFAFSPDGTKVFVSSALSHTVTELDVTRHEVLGWLAGGPVLTRTSDGNTIWASGDGPNPFAVRINARSGKQTGVEVFLG